VRVRPRRAPRQVAADGEPPPEGPVRGRARRPGQARQLDLVPRRPRPARRPAPRPCPAGPRRVTAMCRSIKTLRTEAVVTDDDTRAAALQYVRKISGYRKPSKANEAVFETAVDEITAATDRLLADLAPTGARR